MNLHRLALAASALLLGVAPMAHAGNRHVDISVDLGYYLPAHLRYVREAAPVVVYPPIPAIYYRPVVRPPGQYYYGGYEGYGRDEGRYCHARHRHHRHHHDDEDDDD